VVVSDILLGLVIVFIFALAITFVTHIFIRVPYIPTPKPIALEMIRLAGLKGHEVIYDLGAGDARFLILAKQRFPNLTAKGCELVTTIWLLGKFCIWRSGTDVKLRLGSALKEDVRDADVVFKPGTRVISHTFSLPDKEPENIVPVRYRGREKKILVYRW
jgi:hypothetical protein